jgi:hypothetical protein
MTMCSTCHTHLPVLSSFMAYHRISNKISMTGVTSGAGTHYPFRGTWVPPPHDFSGVRVTRSLVWCVCFVGRFLSFILLVIVLSVLQFTTSGYPLWYLQTLLMQDVCPILGVYFCNDIMVITLLYIVY